MFGIQGYSSFEPLHNGRQSLVLRARRSKDDLTVVLKVLKGDHPEPGRIARFRREYRITNNMASEGIIATLGFEKIRNSCFIILEDIGGRSLRELLPEHSLTLDEKLTMATRLAEALGHVHEQRVVHRDINPSNIIWNPETGATRIIDFGISSEPDREESGGYQGNLEGTLTYISPEQTGRMNRLPDFHTDYYSLGATLYEIFAGRPPFEIEDPAELIHAHMALKPTPPAEIIAEIPASISAVIMKLLAKNPDDRYNGARGLLHDLNECRRHLSKDTTAPAFVVGAGDLPERIRFARHLYGRETELERLRDVLAEVRATGSPRLMLVSGVAGIGKSALVRTAFHGLRPDEVLLGGGKFDTLRRSTPYSAVGMAFGEILRSILMYDEAEASRRKVQLAEALGSNARLVLDVVPELSLLIGQRPPIDIIDTAEAQNRFILTFTRFCWSLARDDCPLILFLDDLQWADGPSLALLKHLLSDSGNGPVLFVGTYRDNEVDDSHPLALMLRDLEDGGVRPESLVLNELATADIEQLLGDAFSLPPADCGSLSALSLKKTAGNPFFLLQFLESLRGRGLIRFDATDRRWTWDEAEIRQSAITDNVVELMGERIDDLPPPTRELLKTAACLGVRFSPDTLSLVAGEPIDEVRRALAPALREGLLLPAAPDAEREESGFYRFLHDRVCQAAHELLDEDRRTRLHIETARHLIKAHGDNPSGEVLFEIADQITAGRSLIADAAEGRRFAALQLEAGLKARESTAYDSAAAYFRTGIEIAGAGIWTDDYELAFSLHLRLAECEYLSGRFEEAERLFELCDRKAASNIDRAQVAHLRIIQCVNTGRMDDGIALGRAALADLGVAVAADDQLQAATGSEIGALNEAIGDRRIEELIDLPAVSDTTAAHSMILLADVWQAAYVSGQQDLAGFCTIKGVNQSLAFGNAPLSALSYTLYGLMAGSGLGNFHSGFKFGQVGVTLAERYNIRSLVSKCYLVYGAAILCWAQPLEKTFSYFRMGYEAGLESGDLMYTGYNVLFAPRWSFLRGIQLAKVVEEARSFLPFIVKLKDPFLHGIVHCLAGAPLALMDRSDNNLSFSFAGFKEEEFTKELEKPEAILWRCWYINIRLSVLIFTEQWSETLSLVEKGFANHLQSILFGQFQNADFYLIAGIGAAQRIHGAETDEERKRCEEIFAMAREALKVWMDGCFRQNLEHKFQLLEAEAHRLQGDFQAAITCYEKAIKAASESEFIQYEALANHLAGRFCLAAQLPRLAAQYLGDALYLYESWGATAIAARLRTQYSEHLAHRPLEPVEHSRRIENNATSSTGESLPDLSSLMKAAQAISGEIESPRLFRQLMRVLIENAGATRGVLILRQDGDMLVRAAGDGTGEAQLFDTLRAEDWEHLPHTIVHYVTHTRENLVLDDACREGPFVSDPYIHERQISSLLAAPLLHKGELAGIVLLENQLAAGVFTSRRIELLQLLAGQIVVSLENADLYGKMEELVHVRTADLNRALEELRQRERHVRLELEIAEEIQQGILPTLPVRHGRLNLTGFYRARDKVGGDFFDVIPMNEGGVMIFVADVSGHGIPAALLTTMLKLEFSETARGEASPQKILQVLNQKIREDMPNPHYVTALCLYIDQNGNTLLSSAGHPSSLLVPADRDEPIERLEQVGTPLGAFAGAHDFYQNRELKLNRGDRLFLFTDGLEDAVNKQEEPFGMTRVHNLLEQGRSLPVTLTPELVRSAWENHIEKQIPLDDTMFLVLELE